MHNARAQAFAQPSRVLVVARDVAMARAACAELLRRGASVSAAPGIKEAAALVRQRPFDSILVHGREDAGATALLLKLLKAEALGEPRILLLVDPEQASAFMQSVPLADEVVASTLEAGRIADAAGVTEAAPEVFHAPAVATPVRHRILTLPTPLAREDIPADVAQISQRGEVPDAVILTDPSGVNLITAWMSAAAAAVVPVIDASGLAPQRADIAMPVNNQHDITRVLSKTQALTDRMRALPESYFRSSDPRAMILARLAVRERDIAPMRDVTLKSTVRFADEMAVPGLAPHAESLVRTGHMTRKFFDKIQCCPSCTSARVQVREECAKCRSADTVEEPIIHHLRCGYQGPERDFRVHDRMMCPKCRQHLEHFSVDYDKPGALVVCNDCGHSTGDSAIGFTCLDCDSHHDTAKMQIRTIYRYALTETGREAAFQAPLQERGSTPTAELSIQQRLADFSRQQSAQHAPHAVIFIKLDATGEARKAAGEYIWKDTVALYSSILHEMFSNETQIVEAGDRFLVLIGNEPEEKVRIALPEIRQELEKTLRHAIGARYDVIGADQLRRMIAN